MGMDSRVVPTSGGRKALHENSSLEQVQALVKSFYGLKPATTQQENGELINLLDEAKSLLSMRDPSCLIGLLAFILRYVIPVWVLPLRDEDQARWLDDLVGPHSPSPRWCVWGALCEALAGRGGDDHGFVSGPSSPVVGQVAQGRGREKAALEFIMQRLRGMVGGEGGELRTALHELLGRFPSTPDGLGTQQVSTPPADVERVMQSLLLLPARLANASHTAASEGPARRIDGGEEGTKDVFFKPENYYEAVTRAVLQVCVQSCGAGPRAGAVSLWSHFVLKAARMGQAGTVARVWVQAMKHQGEDERGCSVDLFKGLALPCLEGVMVELIRCLCGEYADAEERQARFNALVVPALADEDGLPSLVLLIRSKLLLARVLSPAAATLLVNAVAEAGEAHLVKLMSAILQVWKARTFLQRSDVAGQQAYVTAALLACLARMTKDTLQAAEGGAVLGDVLEGVGAHLESAILGTRRHGMTVAEAFAKVMGQELRFDELDGHRGGNGPSSPNDEAATAEPATENGESGAAHPNERVGVEGDLEPYDDLSDDDEEDLRPVPVPRYLRRLIELLRVKDDDAAFDKHSTALAEAASLIASSPSDLPDLSPALTRDLLTLENRFDMPGFAEHRHAALMALVAGDPEQVGPLLSAFAFDHVIGFGARLEVLSLLEDGARGLNGLSGAKKDDASTALAPLSAEDRVRGKRRLVNGASLQTGTGDEVSQKEDGKTRRWGTRKPTVTSQNRFAPKALRAFFRPLLHNLINHCGQKDDDDALLSVGRSATSNIRLRDQDEAMLLAKAIECLCVFVEASGPHGLDSPTMAEELLALAWPLRGSTFPEVRRSVLLCVACGVTTLGMERLMMPTQGGLVMDAMAEWMVVTKEKDPDADCRRIAGLLMAT